jgi:prophage maintenance system killer protein
MTAYIDRLKTEEILKINRELARRGVPYTGAEEYPVRKDKIEALVKNVPNRPPIDVASYYLKNISLLQAFPDGNHRTALVAARIFLKRKGYVFDCTEDEADWLRYQMLSLQMKLYGTYEELTETVTKEPDNELFQLCRDFIKKHTTRVRHRKDFDAKAVG